MKYNLFILATVLCTISLQSYAGGGGGYDHGNGGDMCENRFTSVRDDLKTWLINGGSEDLRLPRKFSHGTYKTEMLAKIETAKIICVDQRLFIGTAEKTCVNFIEANGTPIIQCNRQQFEAVLETDQYILVHHEYAGLAGFEVNNHEASNYEISNQISAYLESHIIKKLVVKRSDRNSEDPFNPASCIGPQMSVQEARNLVTPGRELTILASFKIHTRIRRCNQYNDCEKWEPALQNEVKLYDRNRNGTYAVIPNIGQMSLSSGEAPGVHFLSYPGGSDTPRGLFINCGILEGFDGTCSLGTMQRSTGLEYIGEAFGIIGARCARLVHNQRRFINSSSEWIEQELVILSRY